MASPERGSDLVVAGGGLIGLAVTAAAAERGLLVTLLTIARPGAASRAAAGLLVPRYAGEAGAGHVARFRGRATSTPRTLGGSPSAPAGAQPSRLQVLSRWRSPAECASLQDAAPPDAVRLTDRDVAEAGEGAS